MICDWKVEEALAKREQEPVDEEEASLGSGPHLDEQTKEMSQSFTSITLQWS